jgi:hypothetical protein
MEVQTLVTDAFLTLPLLLIGFTFFFGTLTSNIGMLYLFLGHILIVPSISYLENEKGRPWMSNGQVDIVKGIKFLFNLAVVLITTYVPGTIESGWTLAKYILFPFVGIAHNLLINFYPTYLTSTAQCAVIPGLSDKDHIYNEPSSWLNHITFFLSYVFANALALFQYPTPSLVPTNDTAQNIDRQAKLDTRVRNRKWLSGGIMAGIVIVFLILLVFRFMKTPCESGFLHSIFALYITSSLGFSWFGFVNENCGVRPADVLGIVQGLLSPEVIDNPIVCVGS